MVTLASPLTLASGTEAKSTDLDKQLCMHDAAATSMVCAHSHMLDGIVCMDIGC